MSLTPEEAAQMLQTEGAATPPRSPVVDEMVAELSGRPFKKNDVSANFLGQKELDTSFGLPWPTRGKYMAADNLNERAAAFYQDFPGGELLRVPGTGQIVWKINRDDEGELYKTIEPEATGVAGTLMEMADDIGDLASAAAGPIAGEAVAAVLTRGMGRIRQLAAMAGGATAGQLIQEQYVEPGTFDVPNRASGMEVLGGAAAEGGFSLAGGAAGDLLQQAASPFMGRGLFRSKAESVEAERAIGVINERIRKLQETNPDLGLTEIPPLSPGQIAEAPLLERWENLSAAIAAPIREQRKAQIRAATDLFNAEVDRAAIDSARREAGFILKDENKRINFLYGQPRRALSDARLDEGIKAYRQNSQEAVDQLYASARARQVPEFDPKPLQQYVVGKAFRVPTIRSTQGGTIRPEKFDAGEMELMREIMDAVPEDITDETLRAWRSRAFDLAQAEGEQTTSQKVIGGVGKKIRETLENPKNKNKAFLRDWSRANAAAAERFDNLEKNIVVRALRAGAGKSIETTQQLVRNLAQDGAADNLRYLKTVLSADEWQNFRKVAISDFTARPDRMARRLEDMDVETRRLLFSPADEKAMKGYIQAVEELESTGIQKAIKQQSIPNAVVEQLIDRDDSAGVAALTTVIKRNGGLNGTMGKAVRAGLMEKAFNRIVALEGDRKIVEKGVNEILAEYRKLGFDRILTTSDRALLRDMKDISVIFRSEALDSGSQLQAAAVGSGLMALKAQSMLQYLRKAGVGRFLLTKEAKKFLIGDSALQPMNSTTIRALSAMTGSMINGLGDIEAANQRMLEEMN